MLTCPASTTRLATDYLLKNVFAGTAALMVIGVFTPIAIAQATDISPAASQPSASETLTTANSAPPATETRSLLDGIYLYGQSPQPDQIGSAYMVLQVKDRQVAGAFYMPSSSFDCFQGEIRNQQLALTITNSEEQTHYPYSLALQTQGNLAATHPEGIPIAPAGYHAISQVSPRDREILAICQSAQGSL